MNGAKMVGRGLRPRRMRDSGVEWLGQVPEGWGVLPARNLFVEVKDKNVDGKESRQFSFRYGQIVDKDKSGRTDVTTDETITAYRIVSPDTIMINGLNLNYDFISQRVAIVKERGIITSAYLAVFPKKELVDPSYAVYLFKGYDSMQVFHGHGSGIRKTLNFSDFKEIETVCPPLPELRAIAAYLDEKCAKIDGMVAEAKETIEEYKKWKASVIFEAVTGKEEVEVEGRGRERKMRDSGVEWIGSVPEGWKLSKVLRVLAMPITDGPHTTPDLFDEGVPFVSAEAVSCGNGAIDFAHIRGYISEEFYQECCTKYVPRRDDIFMIKSGATTGRVSIVDTDRKFTIWSPLAVFRADSSKMVPRYLFYYLQSPCYQTEVELGWSFGTQQNIGMRALESLPVLIPSIPEQRAIADYLDRKCAAIDRVVAEKEALIADLEAYKKSLIFEVVTGKREVA